MVFEFTCQFPQQIWNFAMGYLKDVQRNRRSQPLHRTIESRKWEAPPRGAFKINVDGATSEQGRNFGVGVVIRDSEGKVNAAWSKYLAGLFSVMEVEFLAFESGILLAEELKISNIIIESNALTTIQSVEKGEIGGCLGHLVYGIIHSLMDFNSWSLSHAKWNYNRVAHKLAQEARRREESTVWKGTYPSMISHLIQNDCIWLYSLLVVLSIVVQFHDE